MHDHVLRTLHTYMYVPSKTLGKKKKYKRREEEKKRKEKQIENKESKGEFRQDASAPSS